MARFFTYFALTPSLRPRLITGKKTKRSRKNLAELMLIAAGR